MSGHALEGHKYQEQFIPEKFGQKREKRSVALRTTLPSQELLDKITERAELLNMTFAKYVTWVFQKEMLKDPRKQYDKLYNI